MPHLILEGEIDFGRVGDDLQPDEVHRWGTAVLKIEGVWWRADKQALLVEGVVVEHSRAVHPVAVVAAARGNTSVRLWQRAPVERTPAVQRWLAVIARELQRAGAGGLKTTNIGDDVLADLELAPIA